MLSLDQFPQSHSIEFVFCDIDDTLTDQGLLRPEPYQAIWNLHQAGFKIIPVTGRPAGWCEMIARLWPVFAIVGENGAFYFRYYEKKMHRFFIQNEEVRHINRKKLDFLSQEILNKVPGSAVSSDQFCRLFDLAIDFCEDVLPLNSKDINSIVELFHTHGAQAKVSSIHVNGWFGSYDKVTMCRLLYQKEIEASEGVKKEMQKKTIFIGDSPNDEPMFKAFHWSCGVANLQKFIDVMTYKPRFICHNSGGSGFVEFSKVLLESMQK